jgi:hypothetical protein
VLSSIRRVVSSGAIAVLAGVLSLAGLSLPAGAAITGVSVAGSASVGSTLTATTAGTPAGTVVYTWYDCTSAVAAASISPVSSDPAGCTANAGSGTTYTLVAGDYGFYVTAKAVDNGATAFVATSTTLVTEPAPTVVGSPTLALVSSSTLAGTNQTLTGAAASFSGSNITLTYQWWDCTSQQTAYATSLPGGCSPISGATASSYTYAVGDIGKYVMVSVTATNHTSPSATLYSLSSTAVISGSAPIISGSNYPTLGSQTSYNIQVANTGTWNGDPAPTTYNVTWYRCTTTYAAAASLGANCSAIPGSTTTASAATSGYTYTFVAADVNHYVLAGVSANNGIYNSYVAYSATSNVITGVAPATAVVPVISGSPVSGNTLSVNTGTWTGLPAPTSFGYAWFSCTTNPNFIGSGSATAGVPSALSPYGCTQMSSTSNTQLVSTTGTYVIAEVYTNNGVGSYYYFTADVGPVSGAIAPTGGVSISASSNGVFTSSSSLTGGTPTPSYSYRWYACTSAAASSNVTASAPALTGCTLGTNSYTGTTYTVSAADVTHAIGGGLMLVVTAVNGSLTSYAWSGTTAIANTAPTGSVTITGTGYLSQTLTAVPNFTAIPAPSFSYQWYDCPSSPANVPGSCTIISGATNATYTPTTLAEAALNSGADYVYVGVTANNGVTPNATAYSSSGVLLLTQVPSNVTYPTVPATASTTTALVANPGTWYGAPYPTFTYQWYVCTSPIVAGAGLPSCTVIPLATAASYTPSGSYVGDYFAVAVRADNGVLVGGNSTAVTVHSASTTTPLVASLAITAIAISGTPAVGNSLSVSATVAATGTYTTTYQWYQCSGAVAQSTTTPYGCSAIVGATGASYVPTASQVGYYITAQVTVSSGLGTATEFAAASAAVTTSVPGAPTSVIASAGVGQVVVSWTAPTTGLPPTSYTVTANTGASCTASTTTCTVTGLLYGTYYSFTVTATNSYGTSPASVASAQVMPSKTVPAAPTAVTGVAQSQSVIVSWTAANQNGAVITGYTVTAYPGGFTCTSAGTTCTVTGLTNGTPYTFTVTATNSVGVGPSSIASAAITPKAMVPNAPALASVVAANRALKVSWSAASANGSPVTGYIATAILGATSHTCTTTGLTCTITGLNANATYQVSVVATSAAGSSLSSATLAARVAGAPGAPRFTRTYTTRVAIVLVFTAAATNGAPILRYQYWVAGKGWVNAGTGRTIIIRGLRSKTRYSVTVRAVNAAGYGAHPAIITLKTL